MPSGARRGEGHLATRIGRRPIAWAGAGALLVVLLLLVLRDRGGDAPASVTRLTGSTPAPAPAPMVSDLAVYDSVFSKRQGEFRVGESVAACFELEPGGSGPPIEVVVAPGADAPAGSRDPRLLARSEAVPNMRGKSCNPVPFPSSPPPGAYTAWVLRGDEVLASAGFVALPRPGDPLLAENFDNPAGGTLPAESPDPSRYRIGYGDGGYIIAKADPTFAGVPFAMLPGRYDDASLAVEVLMRGPATERYVALGCRTGEPGLDTGYRVSVDLERGAFLLDRWTAGAFVSLATGTAASALEGAGRPARLELICAGETITVRVNGTRVAEVLDGAHRSGRFWIGVESDAARRHAVEARFDTLRVVQQ